MKKSVTPRRANPVKISTPKIAQPADVDFAVLRQQIRNRIGIEAMGMVEATISAVGDGQYAGLKYLFEMVGLFPADVSDEPQREDGLAVTLLREFRLPELTGREHEVTKDSAEGESHSQTIP
jgi:hypothetical protein